MTPSTTNTAARELLPCPFCGEAGERDPAYGGYIKCSAMSCVLGGPNGPDTTWIAETAWNTRATLTQQQGGEQEAGEVEQQARELLAAEYDRDGLDKLAALIRDGFQPGGEYPATLRAVAAALHGQRSASSEADALPPERKHAPIYGDEPIGDQEKAWAFNDGWNACRTATAALRSKPVASEGDGVARYMDGQYWFPQSAMERFGLAVADAREKRLANTSKQAAGEAALTAEDMRVLARLKDALPTVGLNGWSRGVAVLEKIITTPPRHPADEGRDAERYRFVRNDPPTSLCVRINRDGCSALYTDGEELDAAIDAALQAGTP